MSTILHIETSTEVCSVAVSEDSQVIFQQEDHSGPNQEDGGDRIRNPGGRGSFIY